MKENSKLCYNAECNKTMGVLNSKCSSLSEALQNVPELNVLTSGKGRESIGAIFI